MLNFVQIKSSRRNKFLIKYMCHLLGKFQLKIWIRQHNTLHHVWVVIWCPVLSRNDWTCYPLMRRMLQHKLIVGYSWAPNPPGFWKTGKMPLLYLIYTKMRLISWQSSKEDIVYVFSNLHMFHYLTLISNCYTATSAYYPFLRYQILC